MALSIGPLCISRAPFVMDAILLTSFTIGSLSTVAYNAPSTTFLALGGPLSIGLGMMMGASFLSMFVPNSPILYNF